MTAAAEHQPTTADLQQRIAKERTTIDTAHARISALTDERLTALEQNDDKRVDRVETDIRIAETTIASCEERLELLDQRIAESKAADESVRLDELAANAQRARQHGIKIIKTLYPRLARQITDALNELCNDEAVIAHANVELLAAKRDTVESANTVRSMATALQDDVTLPRETSEQPDYVIGQSELDKFARWQLHNMHQGRR